MGWVGRDARRRSGSEAIDLFEGGSLELVERRASRGDPWKADPSVPRRLGAWMSGRASVPFDDRTTKSRRAQDFAAAMAQPEASGRLGRWMAWKFKGLGVP